MIYRDVIVDMYVNTRLLLDVCVNEENKGHAWVNSPADLIEAEEQSL